MRAAVVVENRKMIMRNVPKPEPRAGQVRIKVEMAGICGSDFALFQGKCNVPFPVIGGHEAVGVIDKTGPGGSPQRIGQRVTIHPNSFCSECLPCRKGLPNLCQKKVRLGIDTDGVFAEYTIVNENQAIPIPEGMADEVAIFTEPLSVITHAMNIATPLPNDNVLIFGAGTMGLIALKMTKIYGGRVTSCDIQEERIRTANTLGADSTIGPEDVYSDYYNGFEIVYETSGAPSALAEAINFAAPGGKIVVLGLSGQDSAISPEQIVRKELKIFGSMIYTDEFSDSINILQEGKIDTDSLTTGILSLDEIEEALVDFRSPERIKTLVRI